MLWCQWLTRRVTWDLFNEPLTSPSTLSLSQGLLTSLCLLGSFEYKFWVHIYTTELRPVSMGSGMQFIILIFPWPLVEAVPFPVLFLQLLSHLPKHWLQVEDKTQLSSSPRHSGSLKNQSHFQVWFQVELISPRTSGGRKVKDEVKDILYSFYF